MRARLPVVLLLILPAAIPLGGLGACSSTNPSDQRPSPLPYGYAYRQGKEPAAQKPAGAEGGEQLDAVMAVVGGDVLTRRRLVRETGGRAKGESDAAFERSLKKRLFGWAQEHVFVQAAQRIGIKFEEARLDMLVKEQADDIVRKAQESTGRTVTLQDLLDDRHMTYEEFRESWRNKLYVHFYMQKILKGLGGTRPEVDLEVSPAEVRRIYRENPGLFDEQRGVRFALWKFQVKTFLVGERSITDAEKEANRQAEALAAAFRSGASPADAARRFGVADDDWKENKEFVEKFPDEATSKWLFDPTRLPRDARGIALDQGPLVLGVLETRSPRRRSFDESYGDVVARVKQGREVRVEKEELVRLVRQGAVAWPEDLADALVADSRETLALLEKDPAMAGARFR